MKNISRRRFLQNSTALALTPVFWASLKNINANEMINRVILGKSNLETSRLAFGTGSFGWKMKSQQTVLGMQGFARLLQQAFEHGVTFMDLADIYGSHQYFRNTLKFLPRDKLTVMTKIWTRQTDWYNFTGFQPTFNRFRKETGCDYFDIVLIHCRESANWVQETSALRDAMSAAKERGEIRAVGVSCHTLAALKAAVQCNWVEVILARINNRGEHMDGAPEKVMPLLKQAHDNGKGIIGMKIFACGKLVSEAQRQSSLRYVLSSGNIDAMTIGVDRIDHLLDNIRMINRTLRELG